MIRVIARVWRGWAPKDTAERYQDHYDTTVAVHLSQVNGFRGARLLRVEEGDEVQFTSLTFFDEIDDVRGFAGDDIDRAVVEDAAQRALSRWDEKVVHHEVSTTID